MAVAYTLDELTDIAEHSSVYADQVRRWVDHVVASSLPAIGYQPGPLLQLEGIEARERQVQSAQFLREKRRACLWHVPGFGKTPCSVMAACPPVGIATPTYLIHKWADWLERHVPAARGHIHVCTGQNVGYAERIDRLARAHADPLGWTLFNKEMWRPETREEIIGGKPVLRAVHEDDNLYKPYIYKYPLPPFRTAILDEAHHYRVPSSWHSVGAQRQLLGCAFVYELTATPFYKVHTDLFMQLAILDPKTFTSFWSFARSFAKLWDDGWTLKVANSKNEGPLKTLMSHFGLAFDYLPGEVPDVIETDDIVIDLPTKLKDRLKQIRDNYRDPVTGDIFTAASQVTNAMIRLSQAEPTKLAALSEFHMDNSLRFDMSRRGGLVLVQHLETADLVWKHLNKSTKLNWTKIDGNTPDRLRSKLAEQADNVVGTYGAMSEGVDCSHLSIVHEYERWYIPGAETQGIARSVRQRNSTHPRALSPTHAAEPVIVQRYRLADGPDKAIHNVASHRQHTNSAIIDAVMRSV